MSAAAEKRDDDRDRITLIPPAFAVASEDCDRASVEAVPPALRRFIERHLTVVPNRPRAKVLRAGW